MKYWPVLLIVAGVATIGFFSLGGFSSSEDRLPTTQLESDTPLSSADRLTSPATTPQTTAVQPTPGRQTANTTITEQATGLCEEQNSSSECTLRSDVDIRNVFVVSDTELNGDTLSKALISNNFAQLLQLIERNQNNDALNKQAEHQSALIQLYATVDGLINHDIACSDEICAATFTVTDSASLQNVVKSISDFTAEINAHSFISNGKDNSGNLEARVIFSNSAQFASVRQ
ncbi:hypothetical protein [Arsukibacterium indicum]|uniref:GerMN domain-containing protein n=1 Tax=Arsukibacterium indicum TaxID=2848612 RepID=A0ABS6MMG3_9GAMM|nr:hypothetical protein [Arsukibacterium indicum]MBV2129999.1 hypothetical protein [Arsukibacterium indicum]